MVNVYTPNGSKEKFFIELERKLPEETNEQVIIAGDFNGVIDPNKDKKGQKIYKQQKKRGRLPQVFFEMIK